MKLVDVDGHYFISGAEDILSISKSEDEKTIIIKMKNNLEPDVTVRFATKEECEKNYKIFLSQFYNRK